jgi:hypothetical protein
MDETWLYHYDPDTMQHHSIASHSAPNFPNVKIRWKISGLDIWDQDSILLNYYLAKNQTINEEYYSFLLVQLKDILKEKHSWNFTKVVFFLYDHSPALRSVATQKKLAYMSFY